MSLHQSTIFPSALKDQWFQKMLVFNSCSTLKGPSVVLYGKPKRVKNCMAYIYISYLHEWSKMNVAGEASKTISEHSSLDTSHSFTWTRLNFLSSKVFVRRVSISSEFLERYHRLWIFEAMKLYF